MKRWVLITVLSLIGCTKAEVKLIPENPEHNFNYPLCSSGQTDQEKFEAALDYIYKQDHDAALYCLSILSPEFKKQKAVAKAVAGANIGKCGLNFTDFIYRISGSSPHSPFENVMSVFTSVYVAPMYCHDAQLVIEEAYGRDPAKRPQDINFFLGIVGLAKIGTILREAADANLDGVIDGTFMSACTNSASNLLDSEIRLISSSISLFLENAADVVASIGGDTVNDLLTMAAPCGAACAITDPDSPSWSAPNLNLIRDMIETDTFGIMGCMNADPTTCCP